MFISKITFVCVLWTLSVTGERSEEQSCERCVSVESCDAVGEMTKSEQNKWFEENSCAPPEDEDGDAAPFGFSSVAKGDYVCCPDGSGEETRIENNRQDDDNGEDNEDVPEFSNRFGFGNNFRPRPAGENPYFLGRDQNSGNGRPGTSGTRPIQRGGKGGSGNQCVLTLNPPRMESGCCGVDELGDTAALGPRSSNIRQKPIRQPQTGFGNFGSFLFPRLKRSTNVTGENKTEVEIDTRIAGGQIAELGQFPWLGLLKTTFDYGFEERAFSCGGSLISSTFVLTAAHCVYDSEAKVTDIEITFAEHDRRSFPNDCTNNGNRQCIKNVRMHAAGVIRHSNYDDTSLKNDIALIRLRGKATYTEYIRPICLPPLNIDSTDYADTPLHVAGWGRNGAYTSNVKQFAVVNLVPNRQCQKFYPGLSKHVCAAGKTGEDTCKGDSGGPLMMLFRGKYFISGIVSGKRADAPCGSAVPSLYTNVFLYVNWIKKNIRP